MKNYFLKFLFCFLVFGWISSFAQAQNNRPGFITEYENMDIRTIPPTDMVSPTKNERAMIAYNIGTYLMYQNRLTEAEEYLKEAVYLDPEFVDAMDHLGVVYRRLNRLRESEEMYLRSIELNKINKVPFLNLAVVYRLQNKLNEAFQLYLHVVQTHPNDPEGYYGMGEMFYIVGNYETSHVFFDRAIELYIEMNSTLVYDAFYYKGMIYYRTGDYDRALMYLTEARKGNPNNATLENAINDIMNSR